MARAHLSLDAETIGKIAARAYIGGSVNPRNVGVMERAMDCRPAWPAVRSLIYMMADELYETVGESGNPDDAGIPWEPNRGKYGIWKAGAFGTHPGQLSGALRNQLTGKTGDHYEQDGLTQFTFGSNAPVAGWTGRMTYSNSDRFIPEGEPAWSLDDPGEDVGGLMAQGGVVFRDASDPDKESEPTFARPPLSVSEQYQDGIAEMLEDWVTGAPRVRGSFNVRTRSFTGMLQRIAGTPLVRASGRVFRMTAKGNRRKIGTI